MLWPVLLDYLSLAEGADDASPPHTHHQHQHPGNGNMAVFMAMFLFCCIEVVIVKIITGEPEEETVFRDPRDADHVGQYAAAFGR